MVTDVNNSSMDPSLLRARRLVQLIERQASGSRSLDLIASFDDFDLLTYRLSELCHIDGLPEHLEQDLRMGWAAVSTRLHSKRLTIDMAVALVGAAKRALVEVGADPDDGRLDAPGRRLARVREAARELRPDLEARGISAVYVFGSVAREEDGPDSDVDLAIEVSASSDRFSAFDLGWVLVAFEELLETKVDVFELTGISDRMRARIQPDLKLLE